MSFCSHIIDNVLVQAKINLTASYFIIAVLFVWSLHCVFFDFVLVASNQRKTHLLARAHKLPLVHILLVPRFMSACAHLMHSGNRAFFRCYQSSLPDGANTGGAAFCPRYLQIFGAKFHRSECQSSFVCIYAFLVLCTARWLRSIGFYVVQNINCLQK